MTDTASKATKGAASATGSNPIPGALAEAARKFASAQGQKVVESLGDRVGDLTDRLEDVADNDGNVSLLSEGLKRGAEGQSPARAALGAVGSTVKDKVSSVFKGGSGKGGAPKATVIIEEIDVGLAVPDVYDQWTQFEEFSKFTKGVESVDQKDEVETVWRGKVAKSRRSWTAKIREQVPDRRIVWTSEGAKGSVNGVVTFHELSDDLTRVLLVLEYYPGGFFEKTANIWRAPGRRARLDLKHFRRFLMTEGVATGAWRGEIRDGEVVSEPGDEESEDAAHGEDSDGEGGYDVEDEDAYEDEDEDEDVEEADEEEESPRTRRSSQGGRGRAAR